MISRACLCTREDVARALDFAETSRPSAQLDRAVEAAADNVESLLRRRFLPELRTMTFDWPNPQHARSWRLWLDFNELVTADTVVSGGETLAPGDYLLRPDDGPPFTHVEINLDSTAAWSSGTDTYQRAIAITGLYGHSDNAAPAGTLDGAVDATTTTITVAAAFGVGVGSLIRVGDERMVVVDRASANTGQTLGAALPASMAGNTVQVATPAAFAADDVITIDAERMLITDVTSVLVVKRAQDGTTLAAHDAGTAVYAPRALTVQRAANGTTAASHADGAPVTRHLAPALIRQLAVAEALDVVLQETAGYARKTSTSTDSSSVAGMRSASRVQLGAGLDALRTRAYEAYGRRARTRAV